MARRKIVQGREEIQYRLLNVLRQINTLTGTQIKGSLAAVAALSELWDIPLGQAFWTVMKSFAYVRKDEIIEEPTSPATEQQREPQAPQEKPLTTEPVRSILDELEDSDG